MHNQMSDDKSPFAGISDLDNSWTGVAPSFALTLKAMETIFEQEMARPAQPSYDVSFRCEECGCAGIGVGPVMECPKCGHDGTLNIDRGYEGVLPAIRFHKDGTTS